LRIVSSLAVAALAALVLGRIVVEARRYAHAAAARAARRSDCPFEDDDDTPRPLLRELGDVIAESGAATWLAVRSAFGMRAPDLGGRGTVPSGPVVVLLPERGFRPASLATLGRRVARTLDGHVCPEPRSRDRSVDARAARLGDFLDALAASPGAPDVVLLGHGAGGLVACRMVARRTRRDVGHVVAIGSAHDAADAAAAARRTTVVSLYSLHDARLVPPSLAYVPGALNIAVRDAGHCGLVLSARTSALVIEALREPLGATVESDAS